MPPAPCHMAAYQAGWPYRQHSLARVRATRSGSSQCSNGNITLQPTRWTPLHPCAPLQVLRQAAPQGGQLPEEEVRPHQPAAAQEEDVRCPIPAFCSPCKVHDPHLLRKKPLVSAPAGSKTASAWRTTAVWQSVRSFVCMQQVEMAARWTAAWVGAGGSNTVNKLGGRLRHTAAAAAEDESGVCTQKEHAWDDSCQEVKLTMFQHAVTFHGHHPNQQAITLQHPKGHCLPRPAVGGNMCDHQFLSQIT